MIVIKPMFVEISVKITGEYFKMDLGNLPVDSYFDKSDEFIKSKQFKKYLLDAIEQLEEEYPEFIIKKKEDLLRFCNEENYPFEPEGFEETDYVIHEDDMERYTQDMKKHIVGNEEDSEAYKKLGTYLMACESEITFEIERKNR